MKIKKIIREIEKLAKHCNMTFEEMLEWLSRNDRDENKLPWEE